MLKWFTKKQEEKPITEPSAMDATSLATQPEPQQKRNSLIGGLKKALKNTSQSLLGGLSKPETESFMLDDDVLDTIEENLIRADVGLDAAVSLTEAIRAQQKNITSEAALKAALKQQFSQVLTPFESANQLRFNPGGLNIYLMTGVNGAGKTTTIGKLAYQFEQQGYPVVIGAGDTFRAAAEDQLAVWSDRAGATLIRKDGGDPAAVIYEAIATAKKEDAAVVLLDTAGRLQNKFNLMEELKKIKQVINKNMPQDAVYEALLVVDATTGQNALKQAEVFKEAVDLTGVVLTKLDGSAKGGVVLNIAKTHQLPVKLLGLGESIEDLTGFDANLFIDAMFD